MTSSQIRFPAAESPPSGMDLQSRGDQVLELLLTHRGDPLAEIDRVLADDPHSVSGHCVRAAVIVHADAAVARTRLAASLAAIEVQGLDAGDLARRHADAARAWLDGDPALAAERYGAIVIDHPDDVLALATAHALDFRLGRRRMLRDRPAQVLPAWNAAMPGYASVLAMYTETNERYGGIDVLYNNAGISPADDAGILDTSV